MTEFYQGSSLRITDEVFEVRRPYRDSFAIGELRSIRISRGETGAYAVPIKVLVLGVVAPAAAAASLGWPVFGSPFVSLAALVVLIVSAAASLTLRRFSVPPFELWATYHGQGVCLYRTTDSLAFGQVRRAVMRVLETREWGDSPNYWYAMQ